MRKSRTILVAIVFPILFFARESAAADDPFSCVNGQFKEFYVVPEADLSKIDVNTPFVHTTRWSLGSLTSDTVLSETLSCPDDRPLVERSVRVAGAAPVMTSRYSLPDKSASPMPRDFSPSNIFQADSMYFSHRTSGGGFRCDNPGAGAIAVEKVARGWLETPGRPYLVDLFRETIDEGAGSASGRVVQYRWFSRQVGTVALLRSREGEFSPYFKGGAEMLLLNGTNIPLGLQRLYADDLPSTPFGAFVASADRMPGTPISTLTPEAFPDIGTLIASNNWDFSLNSGSWTVVTMVPPDATESCYAADCGFSNTANDFYQRSDANFPTGPKTIMAIDFNGTDTFFVRAMVMNENVQDAEIKFCTDPDRDHIDFPLLKFQQPDGLRYYMQSGDQWEGSTANCDQCVEVNALCNPGSGTTVGLSPINSGSDFAEGKIMSEVVADGVVTLPSGHHFNAMVVRTLLSFQGYFVVFGNCIVAISEALFNEYEYQWLVPQIGFVAGISSQQNVPAAQRDTWNVTGGATFGVGLFPPLQIQVDSVTQDSVTLSWDPGAVTTFIDGYKVYWDTDSGALTPYAFNSVDNSGQVAFAGTSATISGLQTDVAYYFTVTSLYTYTEPGSGNPPHPYESLLYPVTVQGDPTFQYPVEVKATPSGNPCQPPVGNVGNFLKLIKSGNDISLNWQDAPDVVPMRYNCLRAVDRAECVNTPAGIGDEPLVDAPVDDREEATDPGVVDNGTQYFYEVWARDTCDQTVF